MGNSIAINTNGDGTSDSTIYSNSDSYKERNRYGTVTVTCNSTGTTTITNTITTIIITNTIT